MFEMFRLVSSDLCATAPVLGIKLNPLDSTLKLKQQQTLEKFSRSYMCHCKIEICLITPVIRMSTIIRLRC